MAIAENDTPATQQDHGSAAGAAGSAGERVYVCTCHRALLVWPHTLVALEVTLQQGRSAAPFVSCLAQRSPALRARRASVSGSYLGARLPPVIVLSLLLLPVAARCSLLIYCTLACLACGRVAALVCRIPSINSIPPPPEQCMHLCLLPRRPELFLIEIPSRSRKSTADRPNLSIPTVPRHTLPSGSAPQHILVIPSISSA